MKTYDEIATMRQKLWALADKYAEEGKMEEALQLTSAAQALDWVLDIDEWWVTKIVEVDKNADSV